MFLENFIHDLNSLYDLLDFIVVLFLLCLLFVEVRILDGSSILLDHFIYLLNLVIVEVGLVDIFKF